MIFFNVLILSCKNRCSEQNDNARSQPRDTSLIGLWRFINEKDTEYLDLRKNGDYYDPINPKPSGVWYTSGKNIIMTYCNGDVPITGWEKPGKDTEPYIVGIDTVFINKSPYIRIKRY